MFHLVTCPVLLIHFTQILLLQVNMFGSIKNTPLKWSIYSQLHALLLSHSRARTQINPVWFKANHIQPSSPFKISSQRTCLPREAYENNLPFPSSFCTYKPTSTTRKSTDNSSSSKPKLVVGQLVEMVTVVGPLLSTYPRRTHCWQPCKASFRPPAWYWILNSSRLYSWQDQQVERLWQGSPLNYTLGTSVSSSSWLSL